MSEMVERVALAMKERAGLVIAETFWREIAKAGIEAMREPTHQMIEAGGLAIYERNGDPTPEAEAEAQVSWPAMIDVALLSPEKT